MRSARRTEVTKWRVRRQWVPRHAYLVRRVGAWRRKHRIEPDASLDLMDLPLPVAGSGSGSNISHSGGGGGGWFDFDGLDGFILAVAAVIAFVVFLALGWFVLFPILLVVIDLVVVITSVAVGLIGKVFLGRPWFVTADGPGGRHVEWRVVGWRRAGQVRRAIAIALESGTDRDVAAIGAGAFSG